MSEIKKATIIIELADGTSEELYYEASHKKYDTLFILDDMISDIEAKKEAINNNESPLGVVGGGN